MESKSGLMVKDRVESRAKGMAHKRRLNSIKKMTMELGMLCDIKVCMICIGTDGKIHTWPERAEEVKTVINWYKSLKPSSPRSSRSSAHGGLEGDLNKGLVPRSTKMDLVQLLDKKIAKVDRRIEKLRREHNGEVTVDHGQDQDKGEEIKTLELFPLKPDLTHNFF